MLNTLKNLLGFGTKVDFAELVKQGAVIVDVRTPGEYAGGHIKGSVNIPLQSLGAQLSRIKKDKPVITCCASGMRSASAKSILKSNGYGEVHNGGGWMSLRSRLDG
jgi:phage shock protein E